MSEMRSEHAPSAQADRPLVFIGAAIVALVVVSALVVILIGGREASSFRADSPEGVVQAYLTAFEDGDYETAHATFSAAVRDEMPIDEYERAVREYGAGYPIDGSSRRVLFDRTTDDGERAAVHLTVEEFYGGGGPFGGGDTYRSPREVSLVREDGAWRIDQALVWLDPVPFMDF